MNGLTASAGRALGKGLVFFLATCPAAFAAGPLGTVSPAERERIAAAVPGDAPVEPRRDRRLLIFDRNVGYPGHPSIRHANLAFTLMGRKTGAYQTTVGRDPGVFRPESLRRFDAVFLNNTVGNLFGDRQLRRSLVEFIYAGGGLMGVHGTSVAFTDWPGAREDWPEFAILLGARGANHRESDESVFVKIDDPQHPLTRVFPPSGFEYRDEFFRVHEPYSRNRLRVLLTIDTEKTDLNQGPARGKCYRADNDYALAWVRRYGRGRVFYSTIAHNPYVFWDPMMLRFYLGAVQFALGDLEAPTTPSAKLTPAVRAREHLGWRVAASSDHGPTLLDAARRAASGGLLYLEASHGWAVGPRRPIRFDHQIDAGVREQVRLGLDAAGVRLLAYRVGEMPPDEETCRRLFQFVRTMGVEVIICAAATGHLDLVERLAQQYEVQFALVGPPDAAPSGRPLRAIVAACRGRNRWVGLCADLDVCRRAGLDPAETARTVNSRLFAVRLALGDEAEGNSQLAWTARFLKELHRLEARPTVLTLDAPSRADAVAAARAASQALAQLDQLCLELAQ